LARRRCACLFAAASAANPLRVTSAVATLRWPCVSWRAAAPAARVRTEATYTPPPPS